jgi:uncharacterized SAM-binding protein YcdF (DUF218 family)
MLFQKTLTVLAMPLTLLLLVQLCALALLAAGYRRSGFLAAVTAGLVLWIASMPVTARWALASLETRYPAVGVEALAPADVAIVLGGALALPNESNPYPDLKEGSDRVLQAFRLYAGGKARRVLLSGGHVFASADPAEADVMRDLLISWGVPKDAILVESDSGTTAENAARSAEIWRKEGFSTGLLVTSAFHMPRALAAFRKAGLPVEPASTDARSGGFDPPWPLSILPDPAALEATGDVIKEWLGIWVYRLRGEA